MAGCPFRADRFHAEYGYGCFAAVSVLSRLFYQRYFYDF
jgi:hypothetical protein